ncbi:hypothetical protein ABW21_db0203389 [Orbilia brochopaga]|nr:hypothetical protein ABW21_db0203389 [Drechslerella brochopaga]
MPKLIYLQSLEYLQMPARDYVHEPDSPCLSFSNCASNSFCACSFVDCFASLASRSGLDLEYGSSAPIDSPGNLFCPPYPSDACCRILSHVDMPPASASDDVESWDRGAHWSSSISGNDGDCWPRRARAQAFSVGGGELPGALAGSPCGPRSPQSIVSVCRPPRLCESVSY